MKKLIIALTIACSIVGTAQAEQSCYRTVTGSIVCVETGGGTGQPHSCYINSMGTMICN